jgi:hypothetical protein
MDHGSTALSRNFCRPHVCRGSLFVFLPQAHGSFLALIVSGCCVYTAIAACCAPKILYSELEGFAVVLSSRRSGCLLPHTSVMHVLTLRFYFMDAHKNNKTIFFMVLATNKLATQH